MALAFSPEITEILWDRNMSNQEKVGHIVSRCKFVRQRDMEVEEALKLVNLLVWATGVPVPPALVISWDKEHRVARLSFEKRDYFDHGKQYFAAITAAKAVGARRFLALSAERNPYWILHFAHKVEGREEKEEQKEEGVEGVAPAPVVPSIPAPTTRVVRNVRRKEKPKYTEVPLEDDDE